MQLDNFNLRLLRRYLEGLRRQPVLEVLQIQVVRLLQDFLHHLVHPKVNVIFKTNKIQTLQRFHIQNPCF